MKKLLLFTSTVAIFILLAATNSFSGSNEFKLGEKVKNLNKSNKVIWKIDQEPITEKEFNSKKLFLEELKGTSPSTQEVLDAITEQKVLVKEAKKVGIKVTKEELDNYIETQKKAHQQLSDEERSKFNDFLAGQGITEEQYWEDANTRKAYEIGIYIGKMQNKLANELPLSDDEKYSEKGDKLIKEKINKLVEGAKVEIVDPSIK